jgi:hypothetical protein
MKIPNRFIEIHDSKSTADRRNYRKPARFACLPDKPPLDRVDLEWIGEDIDRVKTDLLRELDSALGAHRRPKPCGTD